MSGLGTAGGAAVLVRFARPEDWPAVAGLLVELGRGVAAGTAEDATHQMQFTGHLRRIDIVTLVAQDPGADGSVLGVVDMEYHQRLGDHRPQARVNDLVVTEGARDRGVGRALLSRAEELARKRGCFRMALVTAGWREASVGFYTKEGWGDYGRWFVKSLADETASGGGAGARPSGGDATLDDN
jgi:GNAT superfamily N-acetyltransferase